MTPEERLERRIRTRLKYLSFKFSRLSSTRHEFFFLIERLEELQHKSDCFFHSMFDQIKFLIDIKARSLLEEKLRQEKKLQVIQKELLEPIQCSSEN